MFFTLKDQLDQISRQLNHRDTRRVDCVDYRRPSSDLAGTLWFSRMKLVNDDDVRTMVSIFSQYSIKGSIELDTPLVRSVEEIQKSLIRLRNYEEIMALMKEPNEEISLADLWSIMFYFITCFMLLYYVVKINIFMVSLWTLLLLEDLHYAVKNLSAELYAKDVHINFEKSFKRYENIDRKYTKIYRVLVKFGLYNLNQSKTGFFVWFTLHQ